MKRTKTILLLIIAAVPVARAQNACTLDHRPDRIRVRLVGCPAGTSFAARKNGDDSDLVPLDGANNVWTAAGYSEAMRNVTLCSKIDNYASECVKATPKPEWEGQAPNRSFVCYADYAFKCGDPAWTLGIDSNPAGLRVTFERMTNGTTQHAKLVASSRTHVRDIAYGEQIHVTGVDATRIRIDLSHDDFLASNTIEKNVVPEQPATGNRAAETTQNERLLTMPKKIIFRLDGGS